MPAPTPIDITVEHHPVYLPREDYPRDVGQIGCACGHRPTQPAQSMNSMDASYRAHARKVVKAGGTAETRMYLTRYLSGPFAGLTWDERYAQEHPEAAAAHAARLAAL